MAPGNTDVAVEEGSIAAGGASSAAASVQGIQLSNCVSFPDPTGHYNLLAVISGRCYRKLQ